MNREIKVVDFTHGTRDSERIDTSIPFTSQFKECKTIQQSNVVMGAFINKNIKDIKNIDTNVDDISDSIDEIQDELVDIEQNKQDKLISGENIKTINNQDILGSGDINVGGSWGSITGDIENQTDLQTALDNKLSVRDDGYGKEVDELLNLNSGAYIPQTGFLSTYNLPTSVVLDPTAINELTTKQYVDNAITNNEEVYIGSEQPYNKKLWIEYSKNLLDLNNSTILNSYVNSTNGNIGPVDNVQRTLIYPIKSNTTYTISKILSKRFAVSTFTSKPTYNSSCTNFISDYNATNLTITSANNDKYLAIWYYNSNQDTLTEEEIKNTLQIEEGTIASPYEPYVAPSIKVNTNGVYKTIARPNIYSTNETIVGEFLGKPLYRKVFELTSPSTTGTVASAILRLTGIPIEFAKISGSILYNNVCWRDINSYQTSSLFSFVDLVGNNGTWDIRQCIMGEGYISKKEYIILEYTKTIDAGVSTLSLDEGE